MAQEIVRYLICDEHGKNKCPKENGAVKPRMYKVAGKEYSFELCEKTFIERVTQIDKAIFDLIRPAIEQNRISVWDDRNYAEMAAKWWVNQPKVVEKTGGYQRGAFSKEKMELFRNEFSAWEKWSLGDPIPEGWKYDPEDEEVTYVGEEPIFQ